MVLIILSNDKNVSYNACLYELEIRKSFLSKQDLFSLIDSVAQCFIDLYCVTLNLSCLTVTRQF